MRIGHVLTYKFGGEGPLVIGGVRIPYDGGLLAHSDGDVALHAATDALLARRRWAISASCSPIPIRRSKRRRQPRAAARNGNASAKGYRLGNLDITIIAQARKWRAHPQMRLPRRKIGAIWMTST
ncbi:2-C-methyl-D-erythritol 2,4-cyclodiphosphate synthase [Serratia marcescens]|uniref:2-C-methyl-D-erythritol 2,4-cyclodiphosphate synthase n=1 Tax=Serratia marcescens TaxID=615 RepID=A0A939NRF5_SERMA|nr:2-C-methyl-D-erythritol 2,4-cyclodiphosphate synthase [Serratia marcescens]